MIPLLILVENILAVAAQLSLRRGAKHLEDAPLAVSIVLEPFRNPYIISGLALQGIAFFLYIFVLSRLQLNVLYPIATGLSILLITLVSTIFFGERLEQAQLLGIVAIVGGIALVFSAS